MCVCVYVCMSVCVYVCMCVWVHVCMCMCVCVLEGVFRSWCIRALHMQQFTSGDSIKEEVKIELEHTHQFWTALRPQTINVKNKNG